MIGKTVQFTTSDGVSVQERQGKVLDKVRVASLTPKGVCAIDQYIIEEYLTQKIFMVFPAYIEKIFE